MNLFDAGSLAALTSALATKADPTMWYITRAAAVSAYILLTLAVDVGIMRSLARQLGERVSWIVDEIHQFIALLAGAFVVLHLATLLLDPFIHFSVSNLVIPLAEPYKPLGTDIGVLALYGMAVVLVSSWLRQRISYGFWRALHYTGFVVFALVTIHGLLAGSDASMPWMRAIYTGATVSVIFMTAMRILLKPGTAGTNEART